MPPRPQTRAELSRAVIARKERMFGGGDRKFDKGRSAINVTRGVKNPETGRKRMPNMDLLRWAAYEATDFEIMAAIGNRTPELGFLWYH